MAFGKPLVKKGKAMVGKPSPKAVYKERPKKPEPDNYPAKPRGSVARVKRLKNTAI